MTLSECGITLEEFQAAYGTNNVGLDTELFKWANGQFDTPAKVDDDCLDQVEFKRLLLFWFGDGNPDLVNYLDQQILPNYQGLMDAKGYELHEVATLLNGSLTTTQEVFNRVYVGNCDFLLQTGLTPLPAYCLDGSFIQNRDDTFGP